MNHCEFKQTSKIVTWNIIPQEYETRDSVSRVDKHKHATIYDALFEPVEFAGQFDLTHHKDCGTCESKTKMKLGQLHRGGTSSVKAVNDVCNFHTHPLYCYEGMGSGDPTNETLYGWCSGEDMREALRFGLKGNLIHLVFTMEGVYSLQTNPFYIDILRSMNSNDRGLVISLIEEYFRATHGFRNVVYNEMVFHNKGKIITPYDWIELANQFTLDSLLQTSKVSSGIPPKGFPEADFDNGKPISMDWNKFKSYYKEGPSLHTYEYNKRKGKYEYGDEIKPSKVTKIVIQKLSSKFNQKKRNWKKGQWFNVQFSPNMYLNKIMTKQFFTDPQMGVSGIKEMWTIIRNTSKLKRRNIFKFGITPIKLHTWEISNTGSCKLTLESIHKNTKSKTTSSQFGFGQQKKTSIKSKSKGKGKGTRKGRIQAFGKNKHKR